MIEKFSIENLSLQLGDKVLLDSIQLDLILGQTLVIMGESGSGKTLLTKLMIGQKPSQALISGKLYYQKQDILSFDNKDWQQLRGKKIAYMVQNPMAMFNPFQKIKEHFYETVLSHQSISKQDCLEKAKEMMKEVHLGHAQRLLDSYPFELSGGMLQRVMLAILLCLEPDVFILDEPTSALDAYNRDNIIQILQSLKEKGKTLVIVTHDYELARMLGDQAAVIYKGVLVEKGEMEQVLINPQHEYSKALILTNPYERLVEGHD